MELLMTINKTDRPNYSAEDLKKTMVKAKEEKEEEEEEEEEEEKEEEEEEDEKDDDDEAAAPSKFSVTELFPWVSEFKKMYKCIYEGCSVASLMELMQYYLRNVTVSINECYTKPSLAARLKESISEILILFLYIYRDLSKNYNRDIYLNCMSDLLAMYIDLELIASRKSKEDQGKISARLTSCLYVYLEHSTEHLLDTLIKVQFMCPSYHRILDPIVAKIIKTIPIRPDSDAMYIRYLLIYRLWKKLNSDLGVKNQITTTAVTSLGPPPSAFPYPLDDVLPKVPKYQTNSTKFLLRYKFDVKKACELFVKFCKESSVTGVSRNDDCGATALPNSPDTQNVKKQGENASENNLECIDNVNSIISNKNSCNKSLSFLNTFTDFNLSGDISSKSVNTVKSNIFSDNRNCRTVNKRSKILRRGKKKKSNEIIVVDLTNDVEIEERIKKRKRKKHKRLKEATNLTKIVKATPKIVEEQREKTNNRKMTSATVISNRLTEDVTSIRKSESSELTNDLISTAAPIDDDDDDYADKAEITEIKNDTLPFIETTVNNGNKSIANTISSKDVGKDLSVYSAALLNNIDTSSKSVLEICNVRHDANVRENGNGTASTKLNNTVNDRYKMTVINQLIERNASKDEIFEKGGKNSKICDLKCKLSEVTDGTTNVTQCRSKEELDNANSNNNIDTDVALFEVIKKNEDNVRITSDCKVQVDVKSESEDFFSTKDNVAKEEAITSIEMRESTLTSLVNGERTEDNVIPDSDNKIARRHNAVYESHENLKVLDNTLINGTVGFSVMNGDDSDVQVEIEIENCNEIFEDGSCTRPVGIEKKSLNPEEALHEKQEETSINVVVNDCKATSHSTESKRPSRNVIVDKDAKLTSESAVRTIYENGTDCPSGTESNDRHSTLHANSKDEVTKVAKGSSPSKSSMKMNKKLRKIWKCNVTSENKYVIPNAELQENIDGLSLLASVSQHVPHLTAESESKCDQIKVKDYAVLRNSASSNGPIDEETDTNDSLSMVSQLCKNPSTEIINQIVGIYPEDALQKVALQIELTSNDVELNNAENEASNVSRIFENIANFETTDTSNNIIPMENSVHSAKENTNVILNGETVVLLQKSPNSNLYVINKAVEKTEDCNSDDEANKIIDKNWIVSAEDPASFEVINAQDHPAFGTDKFQYGKEAVCQEKFVVGRTKNIKVEPDEDNAILNLAKEKLYVKKSSLSSDIIPAAQSAYQDVSVANIAVSGKILDKLKSSSKSNLSCRQNIKQEYSAISNHITTNCGIQGCTGIHSHPCETVEAQHSLHIPVSSRSTTLPSLYGSYSTTTDLCMPYRKHCSSMSCSLQINPGTSLHAHTNSNNSCGRSHCSSLNCTYDIVTHCRQCIHPAADTRVSCIESNSYYLPACSSVQAPTVQEHDRTKNEPVLGKMYDDQILCKMEQNILKTDPLESVDLKCEPKQLFKDKVDSKVPLKKRHKAHTLMTMHEEIPKTAEKLDNYPGIPMMSIAALEALNNTQNCSTQVVKPIFEMSPNGKDDLHSNYHYTTNLVRRDYYKDVHISSARHNLTKESTTKQDYQLRSSNEQTNSTGVYEESCHRRTFKTAAQRKEITMSSMISVKQYASEPVTENISDKKTKKISSSSPSRKTRSSKRNIPKVNYNYPEADPEWDRLGMLKRKRRKTSR